MPKERLVDREGWVELGSKSLAEREGMSDVLEIFDYELEGLIVHFDFNHTFQTSSLGEDGMVEVFPTETFFANFTKSKAGWGLV